MTFTVRAAADAWPGVLMACQLLTTLPSTLLRRTGVLLAHTHTHTEASLATDSTSSSRPTFTLGKGEAEFLSFLDHQTSDVDTQVQ